MMPHTKTRQQPHAATATATTNRQQRPQRPRSQQQQQQQQRAANASRAMNKFTKAKSKASASPSSMLPLAHQFPLIASSEHTFVISRLGLLARGGAQRRRYLGGGGEGDETLSQQYRSFRGIDASVSWECVRLVNYHCCYDASLPKAGGTPPSANANDAVAACPICLDDLCCPRITKCGHVFCLPCLMHHLHSSASTPSSTASAGPGPAGTTSSKIASNNRCPCCASEFHLDDVKPCRVVVHCSAPSLSSSLAASAPLRFVKLHRVKTCSAPYLPVPGQRCRKHSHESSLPNQDDPDAPYSKFAYVDPSQVADELQAHMDALLRQASQWDRDHKKQQQQQQQQQQQKQKQKQQAAPKSDERFVAEQLERLSTKWAIQFVQNEVDRIHAERDDETALEREFSNPACGMHQPLPPHLLYKGTATFDQDDDDHDDDNAAEPAASCPILSPPEPHVENSEADRSARHKPPVVGAAALGGGGKDRGLAGRRSRGDSIASASSAASSSRGGSGGSMYLESVDDEYVFYQAEDGRLCFLSPYNLKCLQHEFSTCKPVDKAPVVGDDGRREDGPRRDSVRDCPLPDRVQGSLVEAERLQLTPDIRHRLRFLSHLPLYTELSFVEINLGHLLSKATKKRFAKEFYSRQQHRAAKLRAEQREKDRERRLEQQRIEDLKIRFQSIDPSDPFFHLPSATPTIELNLTSDDFGPCLTSTPDQRNTPVESAFGEPVSSPTVNNPGLSFSQMVRRGEGRESGVGAIPGSALPVDEFPALGSLPVTRLRRAPPPPRPWGDRSALKQPPVTGDELVIGSIDDAPSAAMSSKKKKGPKVVLFSTGGQQQGGA
jgi:hypothetical protein